jgi:hypothetical protein
MRYVRLNSLALSDSKPLVSVRLLNPNRLQYFSLGIKIFQLSADKHSVYRAMQEVTGDLVLLGHLYGGLTHLGLMGQRPLTPDGLQKLDPSHRLRLHSCLEVFSAEFTADPLTRGDAAVTGMRHLTRGLMPSRLRSSRTHSEQPFE